LDSTSSDGAAIDVSSVDASASDAATDAATDAGGGDASSDGNADSGPCAMGQSLCSGSCVDLQTSPTHCGMCGRACLAGASCVAGVCQATCGLAGLPCCAGNVCEEGTTCTGGSCVRAMAAPIYTGSSLVNSGNRSNSTSFRMFSTLGQSTQHQQSMSSTSYVLRGGLIGVVGGI
jgi:hypothetical protein